MRPTDQNNPNYADEACAASLDTPVDSLISHLVEAIDAEAGVLSLWEDENEALVEVADSGRSHRDLGDVRSAAAGLINRLRHSSIDTSLSTIPISEEIDVWAGESQKPLHLICFPINSDGKLAGALCLFHNSAAPDFFSNNPSAYQVVVDHLKVVVQNRRLIKRLMAERDWLEATIQQNSDGMIITDTEGIIVAVNNAARSLAGVGLQDVIGKPCSQVLKRPSRSGEPRECPLSAGSGSCSTELEVLEHRDKPKYLQIHCQPIRSSSGEALGGLVTIHDITARKSTEEMQRTFLSVVSHELQTPISVIKGYSGLLEDSPEALEPSELKKAMRAINEESERLSRLVDRLLYASRIQAGAIALDLETVDIREVLVPLIERLRGLSDKHSLSVELPDSLPLVIMDRERIAEVIENLIENAVKYSPDGGRVVVSLGMDSENVIISVTDEGIGVADSEKSAIFEKFARSSERVVAETKGTGLGLYIAKAVVEAHGGRIWVESIGCGSKFSFTIPRSTTAQLPAVIF